MRLIMSSMKYLCIHQILQQNCSKKAFDDQADLTKACLILYISEDFLAHQMDLDRLETLDRLESLSWILSRWIIVIIWDMRSVVTAPNKSVCIYITKREISFFLEHNSINISKVYTHSSMLCGLWIIPNIRFVILTCPCPGTSLFWRVFKLILIKWQVVLVLSDDDNVVTHSVQSPNSGHEDQSLHSGWQDTINCPSSSQAAKSRILGLRDLRYPRMRVGLMRDKRGNTCV